MKRIGQLFLTSMFIGIIFMMPIFTKLQANEGISLVENRKLAEVPVLDKESLLNGEYFAKWETYLSDHIYRRNDWIKSYTYLNMLVLDRSKINNIVLAEDGFLLPYYPHEGSEAGIYEGNIKFMANQLKELKLKLEQWGGSFYFVGIPGQASIHRDKYPRHFQNNSKLLDKAEELMFGLLEENGIEYINMNTVFRSAPETEYYYKTDHHYNFEGAYLTYSEIMRKLQQNPKHAVSGPVEKEDLDIITLPNPFSGSRNRQIYNLYSMDEKIQIAYFKKEVPYEKYSNGIPDPKLYFTKENPEEVINYTVYMGGDVAETIIKTNREQLPNILIFGDSYTNAIEPLMYYHFNETRILDLRHYNKMSLYDYLENYKPDIVVFVRDDGNYGNLGGNGSFKGEQLK
jgi:hypothetical protein